MVQLEGAQKSQFSHNISLKLIDHTLTKIQSLEFYLNEKSLDRRKKQRKKDKRSSTCEHHNKAWDFSEFVAMEGDHSDVRAAANLRGKFSKFIFSQKQLSKVNQLPNG
jgi:hypothetical protein